MEATLVTGAGAGFLKWLICLISRKIANAMIKKVKNGVKEETVIKSSPVEQATEPACDHAQAQGAPARMSWARLLKRVFDIDIDHCPSCGGSSKIIAAIEDPPVIVRILTHLGLPTRAPP
jgi:hypothetical protein